MTSRNTTPAQTTSATLLEKHSDTIALIAQSAVGLANAATALEQARALKEKCTDAITKAIKALRADKVKFGKSMRTCAWSQKMYDAFIAVGVKPKTAATYLSAARMAVNEGRAFTLNPSRDGVTNKKTQVAPPAAESQQGKSVHVHTSDTVPEVLDQEGNNGPDVAHAPNTTVHSQISTLIQNQRAGLDQLFLLLGSVHMKMNQAKIAALREVLNGIEAEVLEAAKR